MEDPSETMFRRRWAKDSRFDIWLKEQTWLSLRVLITIKLQARLSKKGGHPLVIHEEADSRTVTSVSGGLMGPEMCVGSLAGHRETTRFLRATEMESGTNQQHLSGTASEDTLNVLPILE
ncbi:hypothetical protein H109_07957 [Trichophyton interdigitale MR816]|uniref:Uncharacterized protein n=1 Tax=Trichophyton interdigitale (strain MR816) TaxID=1215338 RepID=A0A059IWV6_TRIIM|nr:hypothetical protein H109_07957 [Trichophyton interdigitale MR816]